MLKAAKSEDISAPTPNEIEKNNTITDESDKTISAAIRNPKYRFG